MKELLVIDLDKTLIPFDSFRKYTIRWFSYFPIRIPILGILRKFRFISQATFKDKVISTVSSHSKFREINKEIAHLVITQIDKEVLNEILDKHSLNSVCLLLSASPDKYVSYIGQHLGWKAKGSYYTESGKFIHLHGSNKVIYLKEHFPKKKYSYHFAISDSSSDQQMLEMFNYSMKI